MDVFFGEKNHPPSRVTQKKTDGYPSVLTRIAMKNDLFTRWFIGNLVAYLKVWSEIHNYVNLAYFLLVSQVTRLESELVVQLTNALPV